MSFKRDGDDFSQLNLLKKRRVSDLLAEDIPEDEAFLMRCGRYACTVCSYRPVFDTIAMLLVHRNGKKHLGYLDRYYAKKRDLMRDAEKRKQLLYLKNEESGGQSIKEVEDLSPLLTQTRRATHNALLKASPYKGYKVTTKQESNTNSEKYGISEKGESFFQRISKNYNQHGSLNSRRPSATESECLPGNRTHFPSNSQSKSAIGVSSLTSNQSDAFSSSINQSEATNETLNFHPARGPKELDPTYSDVSKAVDDTHNLIESPLTVVEKRLPSTFQLKPYVSKCQRDKPAQSSQRNEQITHRVPDPKQELRISSKPMPLEPNIPKSQSDQTTKVAHPKSIATSEIKPKPTVTPNTPKQLSDRCNQVYIHGGYIHNNVHIVTKHNLTVTNEIAPCIPEPLRNQKFQVTRDYVPNIQNAFKPDLTVAKEMRTIVPKAPEVTSCVGQKILSRKQTSQTAKSKKHLEKCKEGGSFKDDKKEKYLELTSSGWKSDWNGGWVQDEDVEFDSDEDEPSLP